MGKVRNQQVKRVARELLAKYPSKFNADFDNNKKFVNDYTNISTTTLRNKVAGYTTRLASIKYRDEDSESDEEE